MTERASVKYRRAEWTWVCRLLGSVFFREQLEDVELNRHQGWCRSHWVTLAQCSLCFEGSPSIQFPNTALFSTLEKFFSKSFEARFSSLYWKWCHHFITSSNLRIRRKELVQPEFAVENGLILLTRSYQLFLEISDLKVKNHSQEVLYILNN